ncbi:MAG: putative glycoside hydrolase [Patescibacteria group bacterium]
MNKIKKYKRSVFVQNSFLITGLFLLFFPFTLKAANIHEYPKLSLYHLNSVFDEEQAKKIAQFDLVILTMEAQEYNPQGIKLLRQYNPNITILPYVPSQGVHFSDASNIRYKLIKQVQDSWYLLDGDGNRISRYKGEYDMNITKKAWRKALVNFVKDLNTAKCNGVRCWDGVFFDVVEDNLDYLGGIDINNDGEADDSKYVNEKWVASYKKIFKSTRKKLGKNKVIVINGVSTKKLQANVNGRMFENFPTPWHADGSWKGVTENTVDLEELNYSPVSIIFSAEGDENDYQKLRYSLTSAMVFGAYGGYDNGISKVHKSVWLYDEYQTKLGNALNTGYNLLDINNTKVKPGVWRRDFENGIAIVNSTNIAHKVLLEQGFEKINGTQGNINDGSLVGSVTINANDGIVLLGRIQTISYAPFVNGAQAKVYNINGVSQRKTFFPYDSKYPGSVQIVKLPDVNKAVVAEDTYVSVYKNNKLVAKFAPYGEAFSGGVNIAVDRLYSRGNKGDYFIVTGTEKYGPHVRIFTIDGKLHDPGCFPYAENFRGGVFVAIGDVDKGNAGKEIVVSAGLDGGPHVRILNNKCELISPGFMAYDTSLRTGINVAVGDVNGDGKNEIITGTGPGAGPEVRVFNKNGKLLSSFFAFNKSDRNGVRVSTADVSGNSRKEIIATSFAIYGY